MGFDGCSEPLTLDEPYEIEAVCEDNLLLYFLDSF